MIGLPYIFRGWLYMAVEDLIVHVLVSYGEPTRYGLIKNNSNAELLISINY